MKRFVLFSLTLLLVSISTSQHVLVLEGATLIDGTGKPPLSNAVIVIRGDRIVAVGEEGKVEVPENSETIDASGKYVMPGLIDCHIHYERPHDLVQMLAWGVTSANCMFESTDQALEMEKRTASDTIHSPQIYATAPIFTCEHGWWWGEGFPVDSTINRFPKTGDEAREQVRKVKAKGIKRIKLMYDDMGWCRDPLPKLERMKKEVMEALLDEALKQDLYAEIHVPQLQDAKEVLYAPRVREIGGNGAIQLTNPWSSAYAHGIIDDTVGLNELNYMTMDRVMYIPTFCVFEFLADVEGFMHLALADDRFRLSLPAGVVEQYSSPQYYEGYRQRYPNVSFVKSHLPLLTKNLLRISNMNNYLVGFGTDMWAFPGIGAHLELEYMVNAGLTPMQAIVAATRNGGYFLHLPMLSDEENIFGWSLPSRGSIVRGGIADLLVLNENPLNDIRNTRSVKTIIKHGRIFDHQQLVEESKR